MKNRISSTRDHDRRLKKRVSIGALAAVAVMCFASLGASPANAATGSPKATMTASAQSGLRSAGSTFFGNPDSCYKATATWITVGGGWSQAYMGEKKITSGSNKGKWQHTIYVTWQPYSMAFGDFPWSAWYYPICSS